MAKKISNYSPCNHDFLYTASVNWPYNQSVQLDWITGIVEIESWLLNYTGPQYSRWAWSTAREVDQIAVAFRYDPHRTLFLLAWS
jgi:hypothetical protein